VVEEICKFVKALNQCRRNSTACFTAADLRRCRTTIVLASYRTVDRSQFYFVAGVTVVHIVVAGFRLAVARRTVFLETYESRNVVEENHLDPARNRSGRTMVMKMEYEDGGDHRQGRHAHRHGHEYACQNECTESVTLCSVGSVRARMHELIGRMIWHAIYIGSNGAVKPRTAHVLDDDVRS